MKRRVAKRILKHQDNLSYSNQHLEKAKKKIARQKEKKKE